MSCLHWDEGKFWLQIGRVSRQFSLRILHIVKCQISECLDKYLRNIFLADDPCRDWLYLLYFDSKGQLSGRHFPTVPCARVCKLTSKWTLSTGIVKAPSPIFHDWFPLISYVTGNYHCWRTNWEYVDWLDTQWKMERALKSWQVWLWTQITKKTFKRNCHLRMTTYL